jgi:hypothetical protein
MPSFVTCIRPPLLSPKRLEGSVLQAPDFRLQKPQVHERRSAVVLALDVVEPRARDREDRHAPPVRAAHLDRLELAAANEPEGPEEEIVGLEHWTLPWTAGGEVGYVVGGSELSPALLWSRAGAGRSATIAPGVGPLRSLPLKKPSPPEGLSRGLERLLDLQLERA